MLKLSKNSSKAVGGPSNRKGAIVVRVVDMLADDPKHAGKRIKVELMRGTEGTGEFFLLDDRIDPAAKILRVPDLVTGAGFPKNMNPQVSPGSVLRVRPFQSANGLTREEADKVFYDARREGVLLVQHIETLVRVRPGFKREGVPEGTPEDMAFCDTPGIVSVSLGEGARGAPAPKLSLKLFDVGRATIIDSIDTFKAAVLGALTGSNGGLPFEESRRGFQLMWRDPFIRDASGSEIALPEGKTAYGHVSYTNAVREANAWTIKSGQGRAEEIFADEALMDGVREAIEMKAGLEMIPTGSAPIPTQSAENIINMLTNVASLPKGGELSALPPDRQVAAISAALDRVQCLKVLRESKAEKRPDGSPVKEAVPYHLETSNGPRTITGAHRFSGTIAHRMVGNGDDARLVTFCSSPQFSNPFATPAAVAAINTRNYNDHPETRRSTGMFFEVIDHSRKVGVKVEVNDPAVHAGPETNVEGPVQGEPGQTVNPGIDPQAVIDSDVASMEPDFDNEIPF